MPITLTDARRERIRLLLAEVTKTYNGSAHTARVENWRSFYRRYEAKSKPKNFPMIGSSSLRIPFAATATDQIQTRLINALRAPDRIVSGQALIEENIPGSEILTGEPASWHDASELFEQYFNIECSPAGEVDIRTFLNDLGDDLTKLGTAFPSIVWETLQERDFGSDGKPVERVTFDNARLFCRPPEYVLFPSGYPDFKNIPWVAFLYVARPSEMLGRCETGTDPWSRPLVKDFLDKFADPQTMRPELDQQVDTSERAEDFIYYANNEHLLAEVWSRLDVDASGRESRLLLHCSVDHPEHIFSVAPWPYEHGRIPTVPTQYIRKARRIYGIGVIERAEAIDEGISTNVNQIIDACTLSNTAFWKARADSITAQETREIWPNKVIPVDDPQDLVAERLPPANSDIFECGNILRSDGERALSLSPYNLGQDLSTKGSTATGTLALLKESGQTFDKVTSGVRDSVNELFLQWAELIVQMKPFERIRQVMGDRAELMIILLQLPLGDLRKRLMFSVSYSNAAATQELQRQEALAKNAELAKYYTSVIQLAQAFTMALMPPAPLPVEGMPPQPPPPPQVGMAALLRDIGDDAQRRMRRFLETFGENTTAANIPSIESVVKDVTAKLGIQLPDSAGTSRRPPVGPEQPFLGPPAPASAPAGAEGNGDAGGGIFGA